MSCRGRTRDFPLQRFAAENLCQVSSGDACTKSGCVRRVGGEGLQIRTEDLYLSSTTQDLANTASVKSIFIINCDEGRRRASLIQIPKPSPTNKPKNCCSSLIARYPVFLYDWTGDALSALLRQTASHGVHHTSGGTV